VARRITIVVLGTLAVALATAAAFPLAVFVSWECEGFEAEPSASRYCRTHPLLSVLLVVAAIAGPLYGTVAAGTTRRWRPLLIGATAGAISIVVLLLAFISSSDAVL
jgi:uncharacterized BrkB/YihY/UPF0761 family membrane protein